jgi:hypothetical protein
VSQSANIANTEKKQKVKCKQNQNKKQKTNKKNVKG